MDDQRRLFISHCYEMDGHSSNSVTSTTIYNAYDGGLDAKADGILELHEPPLNYEDGFVALREMAVKLETAVRETEATHIVFMCMGWGNDQVKCLHRYNQLIQGIRSASDGEFRPVSVCLTWPSTWLSASTFLLLQWAGHGASYLNKANDADELGFGIASHVLHKVILPIKEKDSDLRVVLIGHSFGARVLSRALYSREVLASAPPGGTHVDLLLGLQGAFSANRFIPGRGGEGSPYACSPDMQTPMVFTASTKDGALPLARHATGAAHIGGTYGIRAARRHPRVFDLYPVEAAGSRDMRDAMVVSARPMVLDASTLVQGHNDVFDAEACRVWWLLISSVSPDP